MSGLILLITCSLVILIALRVVYNKGGMEA